METNRKNISKNTSNIETNRKNINDLGDGVAGATALNAALSSLPVASYDAPISCGTGTGCYSSRFAMGLGCAARLNERLSLNVGGSHVFGVLATMAVGLWALSLRVEASFSSWAQSIKPPILMEKNCNLSLMKSRQRTKNF